MVFGIFTYAKRLNDLFGDAVNIWLILGDEDGLEVATNALLTAASKQRERGNDPLCLYCCRTA
jgi:hypothetical protein